MNSVQRPLSITCLAVLYIAIGAIGLVYHFPGLHGEGTWHREDVVIELTEVVALISGVFLLQGRNWARWLALAWIAFHVALSAFNSLREMIIHSVICLVIAWILFGPPGRHYFRKDAQSMASR
jgi:hypothetical protein